jgi:cob(I)alamin adenosyltransferase
MIHIYAGNGKGKTTSAFGLAMRAGGQGLKVSIFQFLKPRALLAGEEVSAKKIKDIELIKFNQPHPMFGSDRKSFPRLEKRIKKDFGIAKKAILGGRYDMVVLDEIINVIDQNFIKRGSFIKLLKAVPEKVELILTGRGDISGIEQYADYVTVMVDKKHPFRKHVGARKGIEY